LTGVCATHGKLSTCWGNLIARFSLPPIDVHFRASLGMIDAQEIADRPPSKAKITKTVALVMRVLNF
jgi:hypothetical protein